MPPMVEDERERAHRPTGVIEKDDKTAQTEQHKKDCWRPFLVFVATTTNMKRSKKIRFCVSSPFKGRLCFILSPKKFFTHCIFPVSQQADSNTGSVKLPIMTSDFLHVASGRSGYNSAEKYRYATFSCVRKERQTRNTPLSRKSGKTCSSSSSSFAAAAGARGHWMVVERKFSHLGMTRFPAQNAEKYVFRKKRERTTVLFSHPDGRTFFGKTHFLAFPTGPAKKRKERREKNERIGSPEGKKPS